MSKPTAPARAIRAAVRLYREVDYANRRALELRTGVAFVDPWERLARAPRSLRRP